MASFKSSSEGAAATIPMMLVLGLLIIEESHSSEKPVSFRSIVHLCCHSPDVKLIRPLLASRLDLCFVSHQQGRMMLLSPASVATSKDTLL